MKKAVLLLVCLLGWSSLQAQVAATDSTLSFPSDKEKFDYYFQEALRCKASENYADAFELLHYCLSIDSTQSAVYSELAIFYLGVQQEQKAMDYLLKAHQLDPDNTWTALQLASLYAGKEDYISAIELLEEVVQSNPDKYELHYHMADLYLQLKDYPAAIQEIRKLEDVIGKKEELSGKIFEIYLLIGKNKKALQEIISLYKTQPENIDYLILLGKAYLLTGNEKKGLQCYTEAETKDADNGEVLFHFADYYEGKEDNEMVKTYLQKIIDRPKVESDSKLKTLTFFIKTYPEDTILIKTSFDKVLEQYPDEYQVRELHLQWLLQNNQSDEARAELRNVLDMNPNQLQAWKDYLSLFFEDSLYENILDICREAETYFPEEFSFKYCTAIVYLAQDKKQEALQAYRTSLEFAPKDDKTTRSKILGSMGDLYYLMGDTLQAYQYFDKSLAENANNAMVLNNYAYFLCLDGTDLEKAEKMSRRSLNIEPNNSTFLDTYAWICFQQGKYSMAKIYIERAFVHLEEANAEIAEHYGDILWFCNEKEAAHLEWLKAIDKNEQPSPALKEKAESGIYVK